VSNASVSRAVQQREEAPAPIQLVETHREKFGAVLPSHLEVNAFIGLAVGALFRDPKLMDAATRSPASFMNALMECASLGHQPGSDEYYLTVRKRKGVPEILGIEGYRGIVERMYRSGAVASVIVREVCANDHFEFVEGVHDRPQHQLDWFGETGRGDMIGVYAYAILTTGAVSRVVVLSKADVMAAKANSDGADGPNAEYSPWNRYDAGKDHPEFQGRSMWWKTAARRLEPWVPTSAEYRREQARAAAEVHRARSDARLVDEQAPAGVDTSTGEIVDAELVEWPEAAQPPDAKGDAR
jgi:recombination protein RecT